MSDENSTDDTQPLEKAEQTEALEQVEVSEPDWGDQELPVSDEEYAQLHHDDSDYDGD